MRQSSFTTSAGSRAVRRCVVASTSARSSPSPGQRAWSRGSGAGERGDLRKVRDAEDLAPLPSRGGLSPDARAVAPPTPASTSSKTTVGGCPLRPASTSSAPTSRVRARRRRRSRAAAPPHAGIVRDHAARRLGTAARRSGPSGLGGGSPRRELDLEGARRPTQAGELLEPRTPPEPSAALRRASCSSPASRSNLARHQRELGLQTPRPSRSALDSRSRSRPTALRVLKHGGDRAAVLSLQAREAGRAARRSRQVAPGRPRGASQIASPAPRTGPRTRRRAARAARPSASSAGSCPRAAPSSACAAPGVEQRHGCPVVALEAVARRRRDAA